MNASPLRSLFEPDSIVVIGVSRDERGVGRRVWNNIRQGGFQGQAYAVNPNVAELEGQTVWPSVAALPQPVDLAVVAVPAGRVAEALRACGACGIRNAIVLSAGFAETGPKGKALQAELVREARAAGVRILGPNCLGIMRADRALNASFSRGIGHRGALALVSQSGAVCSAIVDWADDQRIGLSTVVSLGAAADVGIGEVLDYLALDPNTEAILVYMEGVDHARAFMSGMRAAARNKPVIVVKAGRQAAGHRAASSHTGAIVGSDEVIDAALRRAGAVRVPTLESLFSAAAVLTRSTRARGDRLAIITNAGGLGVLAVDRAEQLGLTLAQLSEQTQAALGTLLPAHAARDNPVDVLGDAPPDRYAEALRVCLADPGADGVLVLLTPQAMTDPEAVAREVGRAERAADKPILACFMGGQLVTGARRVLVDHDVALFDSPEVAIEAFGTLASFWRSQEQLLQLPGPRPAEGRHDVDSARSVIEGSLARGRQMLSQAESFAVLAAFGIEHVASERASTLDEAVLAGKRVGYPVALKIDSPDLSHKTDVGGVMLHIGDEAHLRRAHAELLARVAQRAPAARVDGVVVQAMVQAKDARELLVGIKRDPALGPAIVLGAGGTLVEVLGGAAVELPPLHGGLARSLWQRAKVAALLGSFRGRAPADTTALERVLCQVSDLACALGQVEELDINPLIVTPDRIIALDARILVRAHAEASDTAHLAIAPYPSRCTRKLVLAEGLELTLRALRPEDGELEERFLRALSFRTKYLRFLYGMREPSRRALARFTQLDYDRELALVACIGQGEDETAIGIARYVIDLDRQGCELAVVIADGYQGRGLGREMVRALIDEATRAGVQRMYGEVLASNAPMLSLMQSLGFEVHHDPEDAQRAQVTLRLAGDA